MDRIRQQFKDIADMIRLRNGTTDSISASEMPELIRTLGGAQFIADSIVDTEKGTQTLAISTYKPPFIPVACDPVFGNNSPEIISAVSKQIAANKLTSADVKAIYGWSIGDKVSYKLTTDENIEMRIIGFNHDIKADNKGKAGITLDMTHSMKMIKHAGSYDYYNNYGSYAISQTILPSIKETLPQEWRDIIIPVKKKYGGTNYADIKETAFDLFLLSVIEITGSNVTGNNETLMFGSREGSIYEYYSIYNTVEDRTKNTTTYGWWLRSSGATLTGNGWSNSGWLCYVKKGVIWAMNPSNSGNISFAFCV